MGRTVSLCSSLLSYAEVLIPCISARDFGQRALKEVVKIKQGHRVGPNPV